MEMARRRPDSEMISPTAENVKVAIRCRPLNTRELAMKCASVVHAEEDGCTLSIRNPSQPNIQAKRFAFDAVYDHRASTEQIYNEVIYPLVESVLEGYNGTVFAYGQTSAGKSYSMVGEGGVIDRALEHIFEATSLSRGYKYLVLASYLEIYNEQVKDLLTDDASNLQLAENQQTGVYVNGLTCKPVHGVGECRDLLAAGCKRRAIGSTRMNADSSRSHSVFTITIEEMSVPATTQNLLQPSSTVRRGKLNLVDLAGSERQAKTGASGDRFREATKINLSLCALGNVISALVNGKSSHIPYRDSKLTRLLQDSLGGNTRTLMLGCISPADNNYEETLCTLRYASRATRIHNRPHVNQDPADAVLCRYQQEINMLRAQLQQLTSQTSVPEVDLEELRKQWQLEIDQQTRTNTNSDNDYASENLPEERKENSLTLDNGESVIEVTRREIIKRLEALQASMVGGERANDRDLLERRMKKKRDAERRLQALAAALDASRREDGANSVLSVYDSLLDELNAKTELLRKYRAKVRMLEQETSDLQNEFELERSDYLDTIRREQRQLLLSNQILDTLVKALHRDCNYKSADSIKEDSVWCDDTQNWKLPVLTNVEKLTLPPTHSMTAPGRLTETAHPNVGGKMDSSFIRHGGKPRRSISGENLVSFQANETQRKWDESGHTSRPQSYFGPRRAMQLLLNSRSTNTISSTKGPDIWCKSPLIRHESDNLRKPSYLDDEIAAGDLSTPLEYGTFSRRLFNCTTGSYSISR